MTRILQAVYRCGCDPSEVVDPSEIVTPLRLLIPLRTFVALCSPVRHDIIVGEELANSSVCVETMSA